MINFFRKTRKKLADDNKFFKYSRYAIGEIVLVVIGILIALSINNWNEERKSDIELNEYLIKIAQNIKEDIGHAIELKEWRDTLKMNAQKARIMLIKRESDIEKIRKASRWVNERYFIPNTSGYEALKNSSYLGKVKNAEIDSLLNSYYAQIINIKNRETSFNEYIESLETEFIINHSFLTYHELMKHDSISNAYTISVKEEKLRPYIYSKPYQGAIHRTANYGTNSYLNLISIGKAYIKEIEGKQVPR